MNNQRIFLCGFSLFFSIIILSGTIPASFSESEIRIVTIFVEPPTNDDIPIQDDTKQNDEKPTPQKSETPKNNSERNIFLANKNYSTNSFDKAQAKFLELVKRGKESKKILLYLANSYFNNSQYEKAVIWYNKLISKYANELEAEVFYKASLCFKSQGAYDLSDTLLENYIEKTDNIVIKDYFKKNPNYLEKIKQNALPFGITRTIISSENSDFGPSFFGDDKLFFSSTK